MSDDFMPKTHHENFIKLQNQDSFHVNNLKFHFKIHCQIFAPNMVQIIIWLKINDVWQFHTKISQIFFVKLQRQDSFHVKKLKIHFENYCQIFAPNVVQTIIWLKINDVWRFHAKISQIFFCQITTSRLISHNCQSRPLLVFWRPPDNWKRIVIDQL